MMSNIPIVNPTHTRHLRKTDKIFARIHKLYGPPTNWTRPQGFITLSKIILEQQVSLASAAAHFIKLDSFLREFSPKHILQLSDEEMRRCQISRQKAAYLRALSNAILQNDIDLDKLSSLDEAEVRKQLTAIKGIGQWTADIYLMFCLQAKDIFPSGDVAVINTVKELSGAKTKEEIIPLAEKWKPYRSLATYYLWHYYLRKRNRGSGVDCPRP
jgi:DNA-3-methyladenine glycosylase II